MAQGWAVILVCRGDFCFAFRMLGAPATLIAEMLARTSLAHLPALEALKQFLGPKVRDQLRPLEPDNLPLF